MKRSGLSIVYWIVAALVCASGARAQLSPSASLPEVMVLPGYDAEIFVDTGNPGNPGAEAVELAIESNGNILASSNYRVPPSFDSPVYRFTALGQLIGTSNPIPDPDGICVDPMGRIMVAGLRKITHVSSDFATSTDFATVGFTNLNWITCDSKGNFYVSENTGEIRHVDSSGNVVGDVYYGTLQPWLPTQIGPPDQMDKKDDIFLTYRTGPSKEHLNLLQVSPASRPGSPDITTLKTWDDTGGGAFAFGPDGRIYIVIQPKGEPLKIVALDSKGNEEDFAGGITGALRFDAKGNLLISDHSVKKRIVRIFRVPEFGTGCPGGTGMTPHLSCDLDSVMRIGGTFKVTLSSLPANLLIPAVGMFGFSKTDYLGFNLPYALGPHGFPGCTVYVSPEILVPLPQNAGIATLSAPIPNFPSLKGLKFYMQGLVLDVNPPGDVALSNAIDGVIH